MSRRGQSWRRTAIRNDGELSPADWANAVGGTLTAAFAGPEEGGAAGQAGSSGQGLFGGLITSDAQLSANLAIGGVLSRFDEDAAEQYLANAVGSEVGQLIGQAIGRAAQSSQSALSAIQSKAAQAASIRQLASALEVRPDELPAVLAMQQDTITDANGNAKALDEVQTFALGESEDIQSFVLGAGVEPFEGDDLAPEQENVNGLLDARDDLFALTDALNNDDSFAEELYTRLLDNPLDVAANPLFATAGIDALAFAERNAPLSEFRTALAQGLYDRGLAIENLAGRGRAIIAGDVRPDDDLFAAFAISAEIEGLGDLGRTSLGADLLSLVPIVGNFVSAGQAIALQGDKQTLRNLEAIGLLSPEELEARITEASVNQGIAVGGIALGGLAKLVGKGGKAAVRGAQAVRRSRVIQEGVAALTQFLIRGGAKGIGGVVSAKLGVGLAKLLVTGRNPIVKTAGKLVGDIGELLNVRQAIRRGETVLDVKDGVRGFDNLAIRPNGSSVDVFIDEVKNVSGRVSSS